MDPRVISIKVYDASSCRGFSPYNLEAMPLEMGMEPIIKVVAWLHLSS